MGLGDLLRQERALDQEWDNEQKELARLKAIKNPDKYTLEAIEHCKERIRSISASYVSLQDRID